MGSTFVARRAGIHDATRAMAIIVPAAPRIGHAALAGRPLNPRRVAILREEGAVETTADGRLRVTLAGFPVLDAVVADLAA